MLYLAGCGKEFLSFGKLPAVFFQEAFEEILYILFSSLFQGFMRHPGCVVIFQSDLLFWFRDKLFEILPDVRPVNFHAYPISICSPERFKVVEGSTGIIKKGEVRTSNS